MLRYNCSKRQCEGRKVSKVRDPSLCLLHDPPLESGIRSQRKSWLSLLRFCRGVFWGGDGHSSTSGPRATPLHSYTSTMTCSLYLAQKAVSYDEFRKECHGTQRIPNRLRTVHNRSLLGLRPAHAQLLREPGSRPRGLEILWYSDWLP